VEDPSCLFDITRCVVNGRWCSVIIIASGSLTAGCASSAVHFLFVRPWILIV